MFTTAFKTLREGQRHWYFLNLGQAYVMAAETLSDGLLDYGSPMDGGVMTLLPVVHNLQHGVECFLKGAVIALKEEPHKTHDLSDLWHQYDKCVRTISGRDELRFDQALVSRITVWDRSSNIRAGETARYLYGRDGDLAGKGITINVNDLCDCVSATRQECVRLHLVLIQDLVPANPIDIVHPLRPWWEPEAHFDERVRLAEEAMPKP